MSTTAFLARVRNPDPGFPAFLLMLSLTVPFGIAFLPMGLFALHAIFVAILGAGFLSMLVGDVAWLVGICAPPCILLSFLSLWGLRAYVALKLRRR